MKKLLTLVLALLSLSVLLTACGCDHQWTEATCQGPSTCTLCEKTQGKAADHRPGDWAVTQEPVEGNSGIRAQLCQDCGTALAQETYELAAAHDGTAFTLTVEEYTSRLNNILQQIRPELSCRIENNKKGEPTIYVFWQENGYITAIMPQDSSEKQLADANVCPARLQNLMQLNLTQETTGENPIPVFDLQMESLQAMIMACDPQISGADARKIVDDFLNSGEQYVFEDHNSLEYYFFLSNLGQPLLTLALSPL